MEPDTVTNPTGFANAVYKYQQDISNSTITGLTTDLSSVSTQDLLNECYKRHAIEKFSMNFSIDALAFDEGGSYVREIQERTTADFLMSLSKQSFMTKSLDVQYMRSGDPYGVATVKKEILICAHPKYVKMNTGPRGVVR